MRESMINGLCFSLSKVRRNSRTQPAMCPGNNPQPIFASGQIQRYIPFSMFLVVNRCSQLLPYLLSSFLNEVEFVRFDIAKGLVLTAWPLHFHGLGARSFA